MSSARLIAVLALLGAGACGLHRPPLPPMPPAVGGFEVAAPPASDLTVAIDPIESESRVLPNGLNVHLVSRPKVESPAVVLRFAIALSDQRRVVAEILFAALAEHVQRNAPSSAQVTSSVTDHGAQLTASGEIVPLLAAFEDALKPGAFAGDDITRLLARSVVDESRRFRYHVLETALYRAHYGDAHPLARDSSTNTRAMLRLSFGAFDAHANAILVPSLGTLAIVASRDTLRSLPDPLPLGAWTAIAAPAEAPGPRVTSKASSLTATTFHVFGGGRIARTYLLILHPGPGRHDPDFPAFEALCDGLGAFTSASNLEFRHRKGRTYGISTHLVAREEASECFFGGLIQDGDVLELYERHRAQITQWTEGTIEASLVERSTRRAWMAWATRCESSERIATWIAEQGTSKAHAPLSTNDLARAAARHFSASGMHVALATQSSKVYGKLGQRGLVRLYQVEGGK